MATAPPTFCIWSKADPAARPYATQSGAGSLGFAPAAAAGDAAQGSDPAATADAVKPWSTVRRDRPSAMMRSSRGAAPHTRMRRPWFPSAHRRTQEGCSGWNGSNPWSLLGVGSREAVDVVMDQGRGFEEELLVLGVEDHRGDVGAGEGLDRGFVVPDAEGDHLDPSGVAGVRFEVAGENGGEPAARSLPVLRDTGVVHVAD